MREGDGSRPVSQLPVYLLRAAAVNTSVAPSGSPPHTRRPPAPPSYLFIYLWFSSAAREPAGTQNKDGGYRRRG